MASDEETPSDGASTWEEVIQDSSWVAIRPNPSKVEYPASSVLDEKAPIGRLARILLNGASVDLLLFRYRNTIYLLANFDCSTLIKTEYMMLVAFRKEPPQKPATLLALIDEAYLPGLLQDVRAAFWLSYLRFEVGNDWYLDDDEDPSKWTQIYEDGPRPRLIDVSRWGRTAEIDKRRLSQFYKDTYSGLTLIGGSGLATLAIREAKTPSNPDLRNVASKAFEKSWVDHKGVLRTADESTQGLLDLFGALYILDSVLRFEDSKLTLNIHVRQGDQVSKRLMGFYIYLLGKTAFVSIESLLRWGLSEKKGKPRWGEESWQDAFPEDDELQELFGWISEGSLFGDHDFRDNSFAHKWITPERIVVTISGSHFDESFGTARPNPDVTFIEEYSTWAEVSPDQVDFEKYLSRLRAR
jgi:hypothetical protein